MAFENRQWTLAARPVGYPKESDFKLKKQLVPAAGDGKFIVRIEYLSVDPYMRGRMNEQRAYADPVAIGGLMVGGAVGRVVESKHPGFNAGDPVLGNFGWQEYAVSDGTGVQKIDTAIAPIQAYLGVLGMPGMTAYFGLLDVCRPKTGETVFVSGAAGAVGALVGQIAKIQGCYVVGSAGSDTKVKYLLDECGFDAAFNYKSDTDYVAVLKKLCPRGIDCYFDNVGGPVTDAVIVSINPFARISICGQISQYNLEKPELGPRPWTMLLIRQARAQGFLVFSYADRYPEGMKQMAQWLKDGKITYREDVMEGFENMPKAFIRMLRGENHGKQLVKA